MLAPDERRLLVEALRPPEGYRFESGIATTFTLDLLTLLTVPLALQLYDLEDDDGRPVLDPIALIDALRQTAGRLTVFCQEGRIVIPSTQQRLFAFLEESVVEVHAPQPGGVFHPKVWVLRFADPAGAVAYRLLIASRNLTADRSWDVLLALDGRLTDRKLAFAANHPLGDFIAALPGLARRDVNMETASRAKQMADEIRRVEFERPDAIQELHFFAVGLGRTVWPYDAAVRRRLIISPFLSEETLERLTGEGANHVLVSRAESLAACSAETLERFAKVYALSPTWDAELAADADGALTGLHAKIIVGDDGWDASMWMGSANATTAAFSRNVEFVVQLVGRKSALGVEATIAGLLPLLTPFDAVAAPPGEPGSELVAAQDRLQGELAALPMLVRVVAQDGGNYTLRLETSTRSSVKLANGLSLTAWPITLSQETHQRTVGLGFPLLAEFGPVALESLSSFIAFEIAADQEGVLPVRFVRALPLEGAPSDRAQRILRSVLENREQVLRLLMMLLSGNQVPPPDLAASGQGAGGTLEWLLEGSSLLESVLKALHESPERLDRVHAIVADLLVSDDGRRLLPEGFMSIWEPIWQARLNERASA